MAGVRTKAGVTPQACVRVCLPALPFLSDGVSTANAGDLRLLFAQPTTNEWLRVTRQCSAPLTHPRRRAQRSIDHTYGALKLNKELYSFIMRENWKRETGSKV
jgi:hypothetical protein